MSLRGFTAGFTKTFQPALQQRRALDAQEKLLIARTNEKLRFEKLKSEQKRKQTDVFLDSLKNGNSQALDRLKNIKSANDILMEDYDLKINYNPVSGAMDFSQIGANEKLRNQLSQGKLTPEMLTVSQQKQFLTPNQLQELQKQQSLGRVGIENGKKSIEDLGLELSKQGLEIDPTKKDFSLRDIKTKKAKSITPSQALSTLKMTDFFGKPVVDELEKSVPGVKQKLIDIVSSSFAEGDSIVPNSQINESGPLPIQLSSYSKDQQGVISQAQDFLKKRNINKTLQEVIEALTRKGKL